MQITIRKGEEKDVPQMLQLVRELAVYENAPDEVTNTEARMLQEGFGENPAFGSFVAEVGLQIVGISIYYYRYSTWKGKRLYLEDIVVTEAMRGNNIGNLLFEKTIEFAKANNCSGMMWQVLDWNESAINFYKKYNARFDNEWINCHLDF